MRGSAALAPLAILAACSATPTPRTGELAQTLAAFGDSHPGPLDLAHVACVGISEEPSEFSCRWRQRSGGRWHDRQSVLALSGTEWQVIDQPADRP